MHIFVATDQWFPDARGGSGRVARETAQFLAERGHLVTALVPQSTGAPARSGTSELTVMRLLPRTRIPQTISDVPATWKLAKPAARENNLVRPDVLLAHQPTVAVGLLLAYPGVPLALVYHASPVRETSLLQRHSRGRKRLATRGLKPLLRGLERIAIDRAARILVLSNYSGSLVAADHPDAAPRIRVVSGGVDVNAFAPGGGTEEARAGLGIGPEERLVLVVRRLEPRLGLEEAFRALGLLARTQSFRVAVLGTGSLASELMRLAEAIGLAERVLFIGMPPATELRAWYAAADALVLPPAPHEGFGMATIEALASGTPVVGGPRGATPEILQPLDSRFVAASTTPEDLAETIGSVLALSSPELRARCRAYACARFSWEAVILGWEGALAEAAEGAKR